MHRTPTAGVRRDMLVGCALDVETTGLDHDGDAIIELALQRFWADQHGRIVATGRRRSWFEDPGVPITSGITSLTGISQSDVFGRCIGDAEATSLILDAHFVVAHNSAFDRGFVERRLPLTRGHRWVCSMADVDWRARGYEGRVLSHLLGQMGWFYRAHRAQSDVDALLHLLDHELDSEGTALKAAVSRASQPTWRMVAADAPFAARQVLRDRGYRWDPNARVWSREVDDAAYDDEIGWAVRDVYAGRGRPRSTRITWNERYASS